MLEYPPLSYNIQLLTDSVGSTFPNYSCPPVSWLSKVVAIGKLVTMVGRYDVHTNLPQGALVV